MCSAHRLLLILSRRPFCRLPKIPDDVLGGGLRLLPPSPFSPPPSPPFSVLGEGLRRLMAVQDLECRRNREARGALVFALACAEPAAAAAAAAAVMRFPVSPRAPPPPATAAVVADAPASESSIRPFRAQGGSDRRKEKKNCD